MTRPRESSRALASIDFIRADLFPLVVDRSDRDTRYIPALQHADRGELAPLVRFFSDCQQRAIIQALSVAEETITQERGRSAFPGLVDAVPPEVLAESLRSGILIGRLELTAADGKPCTPRYVHPRSHGRLREVRDQNYLPASDALSAAWVAIAWSRKAGMSVDSVFISTRTPGRITSFQNSRWMRSTSSGELSTVAPPSPLMVSQYTELPAPVRSRKIASR
jgi:hypothetical protein